MTITASHPAPVEARPQVRSLKASLIREVANAGMGNPDIAAFWFGESDQPAPDFIRRAATESLERGETFYSQNLGRPYLREAVAAYLSNLHGVDIGPGRIAMTGSGMSALMLANQLLLSPGDRVVAVTPLWPNITEAPTILGAEVARVPLLVRNGRWSLDLDRLLDALTPDTKLLLINSPNNPTGWTIEDHEVDAVLAHCRRHGIWVLSDDVYERLLYGTARTTAPSFLARYQPGDRLISTNSFSKAWSMTGFRVGWLAAPETLMAELTKLVEYNTCCILEPSQRAAAVAVSGGEATVEAMRRRLTETRQVLEDGLATLPSIEMPQAGGAMYGFFRIAGYSDSLALAKRLVAEAGLGLAPGGAFGPEGEGWLRWCHAVDDERLRDGIARLGRWLATERGA